jgi:hypothetical protein
MDGQEDRNSKILAERNQLIGILQLAVEQSGDKEKEPAWFDAACRILNAGFTNAVKQEATSDVEDQTAPTRASITQEALAVADTEAAQWMRSVTGRRRAVPEHEVPNMVRSIIVAYLTHVAMYGVKL